MLYFDTVSTRKCQAQARSSSTIAFWFSSENTNTVLLLCEHEFAVCASNDRLRVCLKHMAYTFTALFSPAYIQKWTELLNENRVCCSLPFVTNLNINLIILLMTLFFFFLQVHVCCIFRTLVCTRRCLAPPPCQCCTSESSHCALYWAHWLWAYWCQTVSTVPLAETGFETTHDSYSPWVNLVAASRK